MPLERSSSFVVPSSVSEVERLRGRDAKGGPIRCGGNTSIGRDERPNKERVRRLSCSAVFILGLFLFIFAGNGTVSFLQHDRGEVSPHDPQLLRHNVDSEIRTVSSQDDEEAEFPCLYVMANEKGERLATIEQSARAANVSLEVVPACSWNTRESPQCMAGGEKGTGHKGARGLFCSMYRAFVKARDQCKAKYFVVFESDARIPVDFKQELQAFLATRGAGKDVLWFCNRQSAAAETEADQKTFDIYAEAQDAAAGSCTLAMAYKTERAADLAFEFDGSWPGPKPTRKEILRPPFWVGYGENSTYPNRQQNWGQPRGKTCLPDWYLADVTTARGWDPLVTQWIKHPPRKNYKSVIESLV